MSIFKPELFKPYKVLTNSGWTYRIYYEYISKDRHNFYRYLSIETQDLYIDDSFELERIIAQQESKHLDESIKSKHVHELLYYIFTYFGR